MCLKNGLRYVIFHVINDKYWFLGFFYEVRSDKFPVAIVYNIADRCFVYFRLYFTKTLSKWIYFFTNGKNEYNAKTFVYWRSWFNELLWGNWLKFVTMYIDAVSCCVVCSAWRCVQWIACGESRRKYFLTLHHPSGVNELSDLRSVAHSTLTLTLKLLLTPD